MTSTEENDLNIDCIIFALCLFLSFAMMIISSPLLKHLPSTSCTYFFRWYYSTAFCSGKCSKFIPSAYVMIVLGCEPISLQLISSSFQARIRLCQIIYHPWLSLIYLHPFVSCFSNYTQNIFTVFTCHPTVISEAAKSYTFLWVIVLYYFCDSSGFTSHFFLNVILFQVTAAPFFMSYSS